MNAIMKSPMAQLPESVRRFILAVLWNKKNQNYEIFSRVSSNAIAIALKFSLFEIIF